MKAGRVPDSLMEDGSLFHIIGAEWTNDRSVAVFSNLAEFNSVRRVISSADLRPLLAGLYREMRPDR